MWHSVPKRAFVLLSCKIRWKDPIPSCILFCVKEWLLLNTALIFRSFIWAGIYLTIQFLLYYSQMFTTTNHKGEKKGLTTQWSKSWGHTDMTWIVMQRKWLLAYRFMELCYYKKYVNSLFSLLGGIKEPAVRVLGVKRFSFLYSSIEVMCDLPFCLAPPPCCCFISGLSCYQMCEATLLYVFTPSWLFYHLFSLTIQDTRLEEGREREVNENTAVTAF